MSPLEILGLIYVTAFLLTGLYAAATFLYDLVWARGFTAAEEAADEGTDQAFAVAIAKAYNAGVINGLQAAARGLEPDDHLRAQRDAARRRMQ